MKGSGNDEGKKVIIFFLIISFSLILIFSTYRLLNEFFEYQETGEEIENLKQDVIIEKQDEPKINWKKLKEKNEDIVGWIYIPNTNIDYPILKDTNSYYLEHSYTKEKNSNGSIFILDNNLLKQEETVIYGHNRLNGIMFSELSKYLDKEFFEKHLEFFIYMPEKTFKAKVFSAYSINVFEEKNNIEDLSFETLIDYYKSKSKYKAETKNIQKIVKLSTCSYLNNRKRVTEERYYIIASIEEVN